MKLWLAGHWYSLPDHVLVVYLEDRDKENIKNMSPDHNLYCEFDGEVFDPKEILKLLTRLKKEATK